MPSETAPVRRWLSDIRYHVELVQQFVGGLDFDQFQEDLLRFYAVTRCLEIVSEASRRLPDDLRDPGVG